MADFSDRRPLIVLAVPDETRPFLTLATARWAGGKRPVPVRRGPQGVEASVGPIRILTVGMGPVNAEASFRAALEVGIPEWVVTGGFTGGLNPELALSDLIWDADPGFPAMTWLEASGGRRGRFLCQSTIAVTAEAKAALRRETGADAVEMESGVLRDLCRQRGIASATFRVISDTAATDMPLDFNRVTTPELRLSPWRLAREILLHPGSIPHLIRFQGETSRAAQRLAVALMRLPV